MDLAFKYMKFQLNTSAGNSATAGIEDTNNCKMQKSCNAPIQPQKIDFSWRKFQNKVFHPPTNDVRNRSNLVSK